MKTFSGYLNKKSKNIFSYSYKDLLDCIIAYPSYEVKKYILMILVKDNIIRGKSEYKDNISRLFNILISTGNRFENLVNYILTIASNSNYKQYRRTVQEMD